MKYMILIAGSEEAEDSLSEVEKAEQYQRIAAWWNENAASGAILEGAQLQPSATATTIRRDPAGEVTVTDGPFLEAKEMIGGYGILEVADLDAAIRLVAAWPGPTTIEIRPLVPSRE